MQYYWETFTSDRFNTLAQSDDVSSHHRMSVFKTFCMSFEVLSDKNQRAADLLNMLSCLDNTTIAEGILRDEKPIKIIQKLGSFNDRLEFLNVVADLHALALAYQTENDGTIRLSLHPLVHSMSLARLTKEQRWFWNTQACHLFTGSLEDSSNREKFMRTLAFNHLVYLSHQSISLQKHQLSEEASFQLWWLLSSLLMYNYFLWCIAGRVEQLASFFKSAIASLDFSPAQRSIGPPMFLAHFYADAVQYTNDTSTHLAIMKSFIAG
jgi:hypothetical protein